MGDDPQHRPGLVCREKRQREMHIQGEEVGKKMKVQKPDSEQRSRMATAGTRHLPKKPGGVMGPAGRSITQAPAARVGPPLGDGHYDLPLKEVSGAAGHWLGPRGAAVVLRRMSRAPKTSRQPCRSPPLISWPKCLVGGQGCWAGVDRSLTALSTGSCSLLPGGLGHSLGLPHPRQRCPCPPCPDSSSGLRQKHLLGKGVFQAQGGLTDLRA